MRREIKVVLIIAMFLYAWRSFISMIKWPDDHRILVDTVTGSVEWENYSYWKLSHEGPLIIELHSLSGDADLYVSESEKPGYELDKHNLSSVTCGVDYVYIPADFHRPLGIAIYGHKPYETSEYLMSVEIDVKAVVEDFHQYINNGGSEKFANDAFTQAIIDSEKSNQDNADAPKQPAKFLNVVAILEMLLEMFTLAF